MIFKNLFKHDLDWSVDWDNILKIPQFAKLRETPQSKTWHQEGNCWKHTILVTDTLRKILQQYDISEGSDMWIMCMSAAICHDLGKGESTKFSIEKDDWVTKNHGVIGERITRKLFHDEDIVLREKVCYMVRHHMALHHVLDNNKDTDFILTKLSHGIVSIKFMMMLNEADSLGSINEFDTIETICNKHNKLLSFCFKLCCYDNPCCLNNKSQLIRNFINYNGEVINDKNDFCVYIMVGFPGCGKSTIIERYLPNITVISRDKIRCELGINGATNENQKKVIGTKEEEDTVSNIFNKKMIDCCKNKESFILDNTNLKYNYRKDYLLKIMKYNPIVKIIYIEAPNFIESCIKRREGEIPISVYDRMEKNFDFPQLYECNELFLYKEHNNREDEIYLFDSKNSTVYEKSKFN